MSYFWTNRWCNSELRYNVDGLLEVSLRLISTLTGLFSGTIFVLVSRVSLTSLVFSYFRLLSINTPPVYAQKHHSSQPSSLHLLQHWYLNHHNCFVGHHPIQSIEPSNKDLATHAVPISQSRNPRIDRQIRGNVLHAVLVQSVIPFHSRLGCLHWFLLQ